MYRAFLYVVVGTLACACVGGIVLFPALSAYPAAKAVAAGGSLAIVVLAIGADFAWFVWRSEL